MKRSMRGWLLLCALMLFTSCGQADSGESAANSLQEVSQESEESSGEEQKVIQEADMHPQTGGELRLTIQSQDVYNPLLITDESAAQAMNLIFSPLLDFDEEGRPGPSIASEWSVSEDNRSVTLTINPDAKWQNGESVSPADVVFSVTVLNMAEDSYYKSCVESIVNASSLDESRVRITFAEPSPFNINQLYFPIISRRYYNSSIENLLGHTTSPMGSGPYMLEEYVPMQSLTLVANPDYFGKKPYIDRAVLYLSRSDAALESFKRNVSNLVYEKNASWGEYVSNEQFKMYNFGTDEALLLAFNLRSGPTADVDTRKAIAYSLNVEDILRSVNLNWGDITEIPLSPVRWYAPTNPYRYAYNQQSVAQSLDLSQETTLRILTDQSRPMMMETAAQVQEELKQQGILTELDAKKTADYERSLTDRDFDIAVMDITLADDRHLAYLLTDREIPEDETGTYGNCAGYKSEAVKEAIDSVAELSSEDRIHQAFADAGSAMMDDLPYYTLFFLRQATMTGHGVYGQLEPTSANVYRGVENLFINYTVDEAQSWDTGTAGD